MHRTFTFVAWQQQSRQASFESRLHAEAESGTPDPLLQVRDRRAVRRLRDGVHGAPDPHHRRQLQPLLHLRQDQDPHDPEHAAANGGAQEKRSAPPVALRGLRHVPWFWQCVLSPQNILLLESHRLF